MEKFGKIYIITNDINDKVYIGQTTQSLNRRFNGHSCKDATNASHIKRAINKYGKEHFKIELIEQCPVSKLNEREIYWIKYYNSFEYGYNLTEGGQSSMNNYRLECLIDVNTFASFIRENYPTASEVCNHFKISKGSVYNLIKRHPELNLKLNPYNPKKATELCDIDLDAVEYYYLEGVTIRDLGSMFHINKSKISKFLKSKGYNLDDRKFANLKLAHRI